MSLMSLKKQKSTGVDWMHQIPMGFRFCPTDLEAFAYLFSKIYVKHLKVLPLELVQEFDVYESEPCKLPRKEEDEFAYYFTRRAHLSENKINRYTRDGIGYWRISGTTTKTKAGKKNTLVYYIKSKDERVKGKGQKTNWIMHEYVLANNSSNNSDRSARSLSRSLVLCRIYERKEHEGKEIGETQIFDNELDFPGLMRMLGESDSEVINKGMEEGELYCDFDKNHTLLNSPTYDRADADVGRDLRVINTQQSCTRNLIQNIGRPSSNVIIVDEEDDMDLSLRL